MVETEEIKKLKAEHFSTLSSRTRLFIRLGIIRFWTEQDQDAILFKRRFRWWHPLTWLWTATVFTLVLLIGVVAFPFIIIAMPFEVTARLFKMKVSGGVATDNLTVEPKRGEE